MRSYIAILFFMVSCHSGNNAKVKLVEISDKKLMEYLSIFVKKIEFKNKYKSIVISCQTQGDSTKLYFTGDAEIDDKNIDLLGHLFIQDVSVWVKGDNPNISLIKILDTYSSVKQLDQKKDNISISRHPLQWLIIYRKNEFISCVSNRGSCW
jgi:hypothetical protein